MTKPEPLVAVCGSINTDLIGYAAELPRAGQTLLGRQLEQHGGGKGANQAVSARRFGVAVKVYGAVGDDAFGRRRIADLELEGIDVTDVAVVPGEATGAALICVDDRGENQILVLPGANSHVVPPRPCGAAVWLCQAEIPVPAIAAALQAARDDGALAVCNPSPAASMDRDLLRHFDLAIVNEGEYEALRDGLPAQVVVTRGARGALLLPDDVQIPALAAEVVDTTGAGDAFAGVVAAGLAEGRTLHDAVVVAVVAAAISVETAGCQDSYARRDVIERRAESSS